MKQNSKLVLVVGIILIVAVVTGLWLAFFRNRDSSDEGVNEGVELSKIDQSDVSLDDVIRGITLWMEDMRDSDGLYSQFEEFGMDGSRNTALCRSTGMLTIWARTEVGDRFETDEWRENALRDLLVYSDEEIVPYIQVSHWSTRVLYEAAATAGFDSEVALSARQLCNRSDYEPRLMEHADATIESATADTLVVLVDSYVLPEPGKISSDKDFDLYRLATSASDYAALYRWDDNHDDLRRAEVLLRDAITLYEEESMTNEYFQTGTLCMLGIASLDVDTAGSSQTHEVLVPQLVDRDLLMSTNVLMDMSACGLMSQYMYEIEGDDYFRDLRNDILNRAIEHFLDRAGSPAYYNGDLVFRTTEMSLIHKPMAENAMMVVLMNKIQEEEASEL